MKQIIIDTDGNLEALAAIEAALQDPAADIRAITTVAAGLTVEEAAGNVLAVLDKTGHRGRTEVFAGASRSLNGKPARRLASHKPLGGQTAPAGGGLAAVNAMIRLARAGGLEIITMGPLTNVALAFAKDRKAMAGVSRITMLAGMIFHGDVGPMSEYNFFSDPHAADFVLRTGAAITLLPLEVGSYSERMRYALHPEYIRKKYASYTRIDTDGELTYGANINDVRDRGRKEFVAQNSVMHPFNCTLAADNSEEEITMEA